MEYGKIIKRSWQITWRSSNLLLFAAMPLVLSLLPLVLSLFQPKTLALSNSDYYRESINQWQQCLTLLSGLLLGPISIAGMIISTKDAQDNKTVGFRTAFRQALQFFGRILLLALNLGVVVGILVVGYGLFAFFLSGTGNETMLTGVSFLIAIPLYMIIATEVLFGQRAIVIDDMNVGDAVNNGWKLIRLNTGKLITFFILFSVLTIVIGWGTFVVFASLKLGTQVIRVLSFGIFIFWIAFYNCVWTLAYLELRAQPPAAASEPQPAA